MKWMFATVFWFAVSFTWFELRAAEVQLPRLGAVSFPPGWERNGARHRWE
jgi:hypothetical protein